MATVENTAELTPEQKLAGRLEAWRNPGLPFESPEAEAEYKARIDRLIAAIQLRTPDRVPVNVNAGFWPVYRAGMTPYQAMTDPAAGAQAYVDFTTEFDPDTMV